MLTAVEYGFMAKLETDVNGYPLVRVPALVSEWIGRKGQVAVVGTFDGIEMRGAFLPMGDGSHCMLVHRELVTMADVRPGDIVRIEFSIEDDGIRAPIVRACPLRV